MKHTIRDSIEQHIQTIERVDPVVNAFTFKSFERARFEADQADQLINAGVPVSPLCGVGYGVKNLFDVQGVTTIAGSKILAQAPAAKRDAVLVDRLQKAGAIMLGCLNMDEFAYGFTTENTHYGPTHNPHRLSCIAGGSSGGSGASVAAGMLPLSLGSDTNGSIRVPASLCGVWGIKPTFGRLSRRGTYPFVNSIDHLGVFANGVELLSSSYDAIQGPDPLDPGCAALSIHETRSNLSQGIQGLRIGVLGDYFSDHALDAAQESVERVAKLLGASQVVSWPDAHLARAAAFVTTASEGGVLHLEELKRQAPDFEPLSVDRFLAGALQPVEWYLKAQRFRRLYRQKVNDLFRHWDILICAATPVPAIEIGTDWLVINGQTMPARAAMGVLTQPISFAGCPVVAAPVWPDSGKGLPLGVQVIAAPWREDLALRVGHFLQTSGLCHVKSPSLS
jgi:amidase/aspartyl-tRNA(Asn)/glutamyl-tRNA(Gln) amidotransferase subunit A